MGEKTSSSVDSSHHGSAGGASARGKALCRAAGAAATGGALRAMRPPLAALELRWFPRKLKVGCERTAGGLGAGGVGELLDREPMLPLTLSSLLQPHYTALFDCYLNYADVILPASRPGTAVGFALWQRLHHRLARRVLTWSAWRPRVHAWTPQSVHAGLHFLRA